MNLLLRWTGVSFCVFAIALSTLSADEANSKLDGQSKDKKEAEAVVGDINVSIHTTGVDSKSIIEYLTKSLEAAGASQDVQDKVLAEVKQKLGESDATNGKPGEVTIKVGATGGQPNAIFMDKNGKQHRIQLNPRPQITARAEAITKHQKQIVEQANKQTEEISKHLESLQKQMGANELRLRLGNARPNTGIIWIDPSTQDIPQYAIGIALGKLSDKDAAIESDDDRESPEQESESDDKNPGQQQVVVTDVYDDTPASVAGLKPGDVLTKIDGEPVKNKQQVRDAVASAGKADSEIKFEWSREGKIHSAKIKPKKNEPALVDNLRLSLNSLDSALDWKGMERLNPDQKSSSEVKALEDRVEKLEKELAEIKQRIPERDK